MNSRDIPADARRWLHLVKQQPCSVCDAPPPSDAHHIEQGNHFTTVALCKSCHQGPILGWHGQRRAWAVRKLDELKALGITLRRIYKEIER